jgi:UDP-N-acetylmuramoyl-L-alanyl-D-glutamate--2,6-diaminopimelate ligase
MQLKTLLSATAVRHVIGTLDRTVENIAYDSRRVQRNGMFVALRGEKSDGHEFIGQAIEKGASVIVAEREEQNPRATCLVVENSRTALADFAETFYGHPGRKLKLAAVTGTNGKTTTTFLIKHICENAGLRCGLIGTVRYEIGERVLPAIRTTPESLDLQELLAQIVNAGCTAAAMEVSSHALAQDRTRGLEWNVAVFTNLTQDHLDFHGTMKSYFESKMKLFTGLANQKKKRKPVAIVNIDDRYGEQLLDKIDKRVAVITYESRLSPTEWGCARSSALQIIALSPAALLISWTLAAKVTWSASR